MFGFLHYILHLAFPGLVAYLGKKIWKVEWWKVYGVWILSMLVDIDHFLADPIFDPERCSIGFHPLHSWWAIIIYVCMIIYPNFWVRVVGVGLVWHMVVDAMDCVF